MNHEIILWKQTATELRQTELRLTLDNYREQKLTTVKDMSDHFTDKINTKVWVFKGP